MIYRDLLQHPYWQRKRLKVFERDGWMCQHCCDSESMLSVHHLKYTDELPWNEPIENLITVCQECHDKITAAEAQETRDIDLLWRVLKKDKVIKTKEEIESILDILSRCSDEDLIEVCFTRGKVNIPLYYIMAYRELWFRAIRNEKLSFKYTSFFTGRFFFITDEEEMLNKMVLNL